VRELRRRLRRRALHLRMGTAHLLNVPIRESRERHRRADRLLVRRPMNWAEILEEKNALIQELKKQLEDARSEIEWAYEELKPPLKLDGNKLPAVRAVRARFEVFLEKKK
jgi:hypothetical protein